VANPVDVDHCLTKIAEIVARGDDDHRSVFQLGYNLGRLSELAGLGRGPCWDAWKQPVIDWDRARLSTLVQELHRRFPRDPTTPHD
jgi:hypothetical protein